MTLMRTLIAGVMVAISTFAIASQDRIASWEEFTVRALVHEHPITVVARMASDRLVSVATQSAENRIEVPVAELVDLPSPQLQSVQILYGTFHALPRLPGKALDPESERDRPYHYVKLRFGEPKQFDYVPYYREVMFMFWDGQYKERWIRWIDGKDRWRYEKKKPGQAPEPLGTESVIDNVRN